jgi:hypothetical protein
MWFDCVTGSLWISVCVCVATLEWWGYSTRCVVVVGANELCFYQQSHIYLHFRINSYDMQRTNCTEMRLSSEAVYFTGQELCCKKKKVCSLQMHKNQSLLPIVCQMNPFHTVPLHFWKIPFNIISKCTPRPPTPSVFFRFSKHNHMNYCFRPFSDMPLPSNPHWCDNSINE